MRNGLLLLSALCLSTTSLVAQAAQTPKPAAPQTAQPAGQTAQPGTPPKPAAERTEIKVTEKVLEPYAGEYEMVADATKTLLIDLKEGYLWGAPAGQTLRQLFAESETVFYLKDLPVELTFKKDPKGGVTGLTMNQNGRIFELKKVK